MRGVLRKLALPDYESQDLGDTSTLADPSVVDTLKDMHPRKKDKKAGYPEPTKPVPEFKRRRNTSTSGSMMGLSIELVHAEAEPIGELLPCIFSTSVRVQFSAFFEFCSF